MALQPRTFNIYRPWSIVIKWFDCPVLNKISKTHKWRIIFACWTWTHNHHELAKCPEISSLLSLLLPICFEYRVAVFVVNYTMLMSWFILASAKRVVHYSLTYPMSQYLVGNLWEMQPELWAQKILRSWRASWRKV